MITQLVYRSSKKLNHNQFNQYHRLCVLCTKILSVYYGEQKINTVSIYTALSHKSLLYNVSFSIGKIPILDVKYVAVYNRNATD